MLSEHFSHILLTFIPIFLGLILFRQQIQLAFKNSFSRGLSSFFIILIIIQFGFSQPLMAFHHQSQNSGSHFCCIIQPAISSAAPPVLPQIPEYPISSSPLPYNLYPITYFPYTSRSPPLS